MSKESASFPIYLPSGVKEAGDIIGPSDEFLIYYDPDIDGLFAGLLCELFLDGLNSHFKAQGMNRYLSYACYMNDDRKHGFTLSESQIAEIRGRTVLAVDFTITPDDMRRLVDSGLNIVNIDHHNIDEDSLFYYESERVMEDGSTRKFKGIIINNQYSFEPDEFRFLSGAGMVFYTFSALVPQFMTEEHKALVGLTLLSDIREIENKIAHAFLKATYVNNSPRFNYYINMTRDPKDYDFGIANLDRNFADYSFAPKINALFRLNKNQLAMDIARMKVPLTMAKELPLYKDKQNGVIEIVNNNLTYIEKSALYVGIINKEEMDELIPYANVELTNFVGVACSRVRNAMNRTSLLFVQDSSGKMLRGSVRGKFDNVDYLGIFRKHGIKCDGHKVAFGVTYLDIKSVDLDALNEDIIKAERYGEEHQYDNRIFTTKNLEFWNMYNGERVAVSNNFLRDSKRFLVKYEGPADAVECKEYFNKEKGKVTFWSYKVNGIQIKSFEENMTPLNCLILPIASHSRGEDGYIQYYLRKPN